MSLSSWKQFSFLQYSPIRDPNFNTESPLFSDSSLSAIFASDQYIIFATAPATIKIVNYELNVVHSFMAFESQYTISYLRLHSVNNVNILCAIGEPPGAPAVIKLWNLDKMIAEPNAFNYMHHYITMVQIQNGLNQFPLTAFATSLDFSVSAFGFANGVTILVRGNLITDKGSRQRVIYEYNGEPVTGVHLFGNGAGSQEYYLYVLTTSKILLFDTTGRNQNTPLKVLENSHGSNLYCNDLVKSNHNLVSCDVGTNSVDFFNFKFGKVNSIKTSKKLAHSRVHAFGDHYLLLVSSVDSDLSSDSQYATESPDPLFGLSGHGSDFQTTKVTVIDYTHNFVIFTLTLSHAVAQVFSTNDFLFLLTSNGILYKLEEKTVKEKLQILLQRDLFPIAIQLADEQISADDKEITTKELLIIKKKYGDYLYKKGEFQESIDQYIEAIDLQNNSFNLEVILKFKDNDKISYLTEYLEHVCFTNKNVFESQLIKHLDDKVNEDYLTLLLCNYCKLKDRKKLAVFINELERVKQKYKDEEESIVSYLNLNFNLDLILDLLLKIDFHEIILKISFIFKYYSMILDILIRFRHFNLCITFLRYLKINDIFTLLLSDSSHSNYTKILLKNLPKETTAFLIDIFTGTYKPDVEESSIYELFGNLSLEHRPKTANTESQSPTYQPPKPRLVFLSFVDNPAEFITFLEAVLTNYDRFDKFNTNQKDKSDILITLFEMYLNNGHGESKGIELYKKHRDLMDYNTVLLMCHLNDVSDEELLLSLSEVENDSNTDTSDFEGISELGPLSPQFDAVIASLDGFSKGKIDIYLNPLDKDQSRVSATTASELVRGALRADNITRVCEHLNRHGGRYPELYSVTLMHVIQKNSKPYLVEEFGERNLVITMIQVLRSNQATVAQLVGFLSATPVVEFRLLKSFLADHLASQAEEIEKNEKLYQHYSKEIETKKAEIQKLSTAKDNDGPNFTVVNLKNCHLCGQTLDLPVVHFMCSHAYHQRCLNELEYDSYAEDSKAFRCPKCLSDSETVRSLRQQQDEIGSKNKVFAQALKNSDDKMKLVAEFFGRGAMEHSRFVRFDK